MKAAKFSGLIFYSKKVWVKGKNKVVTIYGWQICRNDVIMAESPEDQIFWKLESAERNLRYCCQILYPHTISNQVVTEAVERFKKENSKV